jgi:hypothetical protein
MIRKAYVRRAHDRLERLEYDIEHLRKAAATPVSEIAERSDRERRDLLAQAEAVRTRIRAVETAGPSSWGPLKDAVDTGLRDLENAIRNAAERARRADSADR